MRAVVILTISVLLLSCNAEPEAGAVAPADPSRDQARRAQEATVDPIGAESPSHRNETASATATATVAPPDPSRDQARRAQEATVAPADPRPAPYMKTPTIPVPADAKPNRLSLSKGGSLVLPSGTREIKVDEGDTTVRHYYLNHPQARGLKVTEYPLGDNPCEALIAAREAAFEAGYANKDPEFLKLHRFHRGARCKAARAACYYSDTSRRTQDEVDKGARLHREAAYLLCKEGVAISIAWKVPDGADVSPAVLEALTAIAGSFTTR